MLNNFTPNNMREYYVKQSMKKTSGYSLKHQCQVNLKKTSGYSLKHQCQVLNLTKITQYFIQGTNDANFIDKNCQMKKLSPNTQIISIHHLFHRNIS